MAATMQRVSISDRCVALCCLPVLPVLQTARDPGGAVRRVRQCILPAVSLSGPGRTLGAGLHRPCEDIAGRQDHWRAVVCRRVLCCVVFNLWL